MEECACAGGRRVLNQLTHLRQLSIKYHGLEISSVHITVILKWIRHQWTLVGYYFVFSGVSNANHGYLILLSGWPATDQEAAILVSISPILLNTSTCLSVGTINAHRWAHYVLYGWAYFCPHTGSLLATETAIFLGYRGARGLLTMWIYCFSSPKSAPVYPLTSLPTPGVASLVWVAVTIWHCYYSCSAVTLL